MRVGLLEGRLSGTSTLHARTCGHYVWDSLLVAHWAESSPASVKTTAQMWSGWPAGNLAKRGRPQPRIGRSGPCLVEAATFGRRGSNICRGHPCFGGSQPKVGPDLVDPPNPAEPTPASVEAMCGRIVHCEKLACRPYSQVGSGSRSQLLRRDWRQKRQIVSNCETRAHVFG